MNKNKFEYLFCNPKNFTNEYEKGIVHGMAFFADKLKWGEEYYLQARAANMNLNSISEGITKENWPKMQQDMYEILNNVIQNFSAQINIDPPFYTDKEFKNHIENIKKQLK